MLSYKRKHMGKYFTQSELIASTEAYKRKIDNTPGEEEKEHLDELIEFMDDIRGAWGSAIIVRSGYRCPELNKAIGGVKKSAHQTGYAVDCVPANNKKKKFFEFCKEYLKDRDFDELLFEKNNSGSIWIHIALKSIDGKQRRKIRTLEVK